MNGFDYLREQVKGQKDLALKQTVDYLLTCENMEEKYRNKEKNIKEMASFIRQKGTKAIRNGWDYVPDEVVFAWAVMYYSLPNSLLKIKTNTAKKNNSQNEDSQNKTDNIISLEKAKKDIDKKEETKQISLFGGADDE